MSALGSNQPFWVTFSNDGSYPYPSTGDVIDTKSLTIVAELRNEKAERVQSERMLEIDLAGAKVLRAGDQFGVGSKAG